MFLSQSLNEGNRTTEEMTGEECYELLSVPVWYFLWSLIFSLHSLVLGNIIYNVRVGLGRIYLPTTYNNILIIEIYNGELERSR